MIFITRNLQPDSPLLRWATARGRQLIGRSLLRFAPVPFVAPADTDWWFFYSKRAVQFAGAIPTNVRIGAIGSSTAAALLSTHRAVDFCGNGHPRQTAEDFLSVAEGSRVFFPRARQSRLSIQKALQERITVQDAVCYDNRAAPPEAPIEATVYIFTSPLNVAAYLDHWPLAAGAQVLAIGPSTAAALAERGVSSEWPRVAGEAELISLLERALPSGNQPPPPAVPSV